MMRSERTLNETTLPPHPHTRVPHPYPAWKPARTRLTRTPEPGRGSDARAYSVATVDGLLQGALQFVVGGVVGRLVHGSLQNREFTGACEEPVLRVGRTAEPDPWASRRKRGRHCPRTRSSAPRRVRPGSPRTSGSRNVGRRAAAPDGGDRAAGSY